jgi:exopolysaccharide biosynthesis polyprenyl glycosylphosphotransferase
VPVLGASWDLESAVHEHDVEHVIVTFSTAPHSVLLHLVRRCRALGLEVSLVPRLFEEISNRVSVEHLGGIALLRVDQADPRGWQFEIKYVLDRITGVALVLIFALPMLVVAAAVRLTSPGPVFFRQARVGLDGREFDILKFRTMRIDPEQHENDAAWMAAQLGQAQTGGDAPAPPSPDRRTPIGRVLRRWSLDELPQLLNIARGDMSLIGPRPERTGVVRNFERHVYRYGDRHRVKSGLTGWAQVHGLRGRTSLADRVEWDNYYVENWSPWLDLKILLLTIPAVLAGRGAE